MNTNYVRYQITKDGRQVSEADWYYDSVPLAMERGQVFLCQAEFTVAATTTKFCQLVTGADKDTYLLGFTMLTSALNYKFEIKEDPTVTDGTTALAKVNLNRQSANTAQYVIYTDPTNVSGGTIIETIRQFQIGQGAVATTSGKILNEGQVKIKLARDTNYSLEITNNDDSQASVFSQIYIYER